MWHWFLTWMLVCVCVCASVTSEGKWMQLRLIRVQSMPVVLSQAPLSFNMPFPMWISLSHVTKLDTHISSRPFFPFRGSCFSSLSVPLCEVPPTPRPYPPSMPPPSLIHCQVHLPVPRQLRSILSLNSTLRIAVTDCLNYCESQGKLGRSTHRLIKPEKSIKWNYLLVFFLKLAFGAAAWHSHVRLSNIL